MSSHWANYNTSSWENCDNLGYYSHLQKLERICRKNVYSESTIVKESVRYGTGNEENVEYIFQVRENFSFHTEGERYIRKLLI